MFKGNGYNLSDIAAVTRNGNGDGMFGDNGWWIILLFLFAGWGRGFGGLGGFGGEGGGLVIGVVTDQASGIILLCVNRAVHHDPAEGAGRLAIARVVADQATGIVSLRFDDAYIAVFVGDGIIECYGIHVTGCFLGFANQIASLRMVRIGIEVI